MLRSLSRRQVLTCGAAALVDLRSRAPSNDRGTVQEFRRRFERTRSMGWRTSPAAVLPVAVSQAQALRRLLPRTRGTERAQLTTLAARTAEYAGWMAQESGDDRAALWWTGQAVDLAADAGDHDLAAYALVRHALITLYRRDGASTVELARRAQAHPRASVRTRGLAALREAQGHALAGDHGNCMRALDRARSLLARTTDGDGPVLGTTSVSDPVGVVTGWCLHDLGRPAAAAEVLDHAVARIPADATRAWFRFAARLALAHATAGEVDHACEITHRLLGPVGQVASHTVLTDLRALAGTLRPWSAHGPVRELQPLLATALRPTP